ncbi:hypothetical protein [Streptomyces sp. NPDC060010]|uniref:hypothetical protein n=1 Tax=Streptomyces sp. NPDC060010 TaxID=3347036 RepID=UPI0036CEDA45
MEDSPTPLLDLTSNLLNAVQDLKRGLDSSIAFTEYPESINMTVSAGNVDFTFGDELEASWRVDEFIAESIRFSEDVIGYAIASHPSLRHNSFIEEIIRKLE